MTPGYEQLVFRLRPRSPIAAGGVWLKLTRDLVRPLSNSSAIADASSSTSLMSESLSGGRELRQILLEEERDARLLE